MFTPEELTTRFEFCIPEAKWVSDLTVIQADLKAVTRICERIQDDARKFKFEPGVKAVTMMEERVLFADLVSAAITYF